MLVTYGWDYVYLAELWGLNNPEDEFILNDWEPLQEYIEKEYEFQ